MKKTTKKRKPRFKQAGKRLKKSVEAVKESELIIEEEEDVERFVSPMIYSLIPQEYQEAQKMKKNLLKQYEGKALDEIFSGEELIFQENTCYYIKDQTKVNFKIMNPNKVKKNLLSDLKLLYGIGEVTERKLKQQGFKSIDELINHPRFGIEATDFLTLINKCDTNQIIEWMGRYLPKSHPLVLHSAGFHQKEDFIILDIESLGLFTRPIILVGVAKIVDDTIQTHLYFVRDINEEPGALNAFIANITDSCAFISYNGRSFDLPYIRERLAYYGIRADLNKPHFDLLHFSRRAWKHNLPNCRLNTIEEHLLNIVRKDDVPSALVPEFYDTYMKTQNIGPIIPIIEHNKQDLISLAYIFSLLLKEWEDNW